MTIIPSIVIHHSPYFIAWLSDPTATPARTTATGTLRLKLTAARCASPHSACRWWWRVVTKKYEDIMGEWGFNAIFEIYLMVYFMDLGVNQQ